MNNYGYDKAELERVLRRMYFMHRDGEDCVLIKKDIIGWIKYLRSEAASVMDNEMQAVCGIAARGEDIIIMLDIRGAPKACLAYIESNSISNPSFRLDFVDREDVTPIIITQGTHELIKEITSCGAKSKIKDTFIAPPEIAEQIKEKALAAKYPDAMDIMAPVEDIGSVKAEGVCIDG